MASSRVSTTDVFVRSLTPRVADVVRRRLGDSAGDLRFFAPAAAAQASGGVAFHPVEHGPVGIEPAFFRLVREIADNTAERLSRVDRRIFNGWFPRHDLRDAFQVGTSLRLAIDVVPDIMGFLLQPGRSRDVVLVNTGLHEHQVRMIERYLGVEDRGARIRCVTTASEQFLSKLHDQFLQQDLSAAGEAASHVESLPRANALVLCASLDETPQLGALVELMNERGGATVLAKTDSEENRRACEHLASRGATGVMPASTFRQLRGRPRVVATILKMFSRLRRRHEQLEAETREYSILHIARLVDLVHRAVSYDTLIDAVQPRIIAGALDRAVDGPLATMFSERGRLSVVNFQYGTFTPVQIMDLVPFDLVLAWNARSRRSLVATGFTTGERVSVVGNPSWDELQLEGQPSPSSQALQEWADGAPLIAAFPQPVKGPFMTAASEQAFFEWLRDAVVAHDDVRLVVKLRSPGAELPLGRLLEPLVVRDRCRFISPAEFGIGDILAVAAIGVSVFSSALADTVAAGRPAVAIDLHGVATNFDFHDAVHVCRTQPEFERTVAEILKDGAAHGPVSPELLPPFDAPYPHRLEAALAATGTIPAVAARS